MALNFPASPSVNQAYTSNNHSWIWNGVTWVTNNSNIYTTFPFDEFSGNGSTVTYSLSRSPIGNSAIVVTVSGVTQIPDGTSYNVSANQLTFSSPPPVGTNNIVVLYLGSYSLVSSALTINPISANTSSGPFNPILVNTSSSNATPYVANTFQFVSSNGYFATSGNVNFGGSITSATWNGNPIGILYGGTGQTTASSAYNALTPLTITGDIVYEASAGTAARLPIGTSGQVLTVVSGLPAWSNASGGGGGSSSGSNIFLSNNFGGF